MNTANLNNTLMGTSIDDLRMMQQQEYQGNQTLQHEQGHNASHQVNQNMHDQYYNLDDPDIEILAQDIADGLPEDSILSGELEDIEEDEEELGGYLNFIPAMFRELIVMFIIFFALSLPTVRNTAGKYIPQINPNAFGEVSNVGIAIYGAVMVLLYALAKRLLL